ncbi:MAG: alpha/beta hydrolase [Proteobacteria bacterium]|nr:alpha/beta hydrolase [Pseudomonadota bacterium]
MKINLHKLISPLLFFLGILLSSLACSAPSQPSYPSSMLPRGVSEHFIVANGIRLHYLEEGKGPLVILLHGWPETSLAWSKTISALSTQYHVVAPDLRGIGLSERTQKGYDKKTIATDIKSLIEALGEKQAVIIGHDMGGKVAYVMAHLYPQYVSKLVLVDCLIPGTENTDIYHGGAWHYGFHMAPEIPEMLTKGREEEYISAQIKTWTFKKNAISEDLIHEYAKYYATKGGMTAGFNYYRALKDDAALVNTFANEKLSMPVLAISGRHGVGDKLGEALKNQTTSLKTVIVEDSGHFVAEESPKEFQSIVLQFLNNH